MKLKMIISMLLICLVLPAPAKDRDDRELYDQARLKIFEKEWRGALKDLDRLVEEFPDSRYFSPALFYKAKCQEELERIEEALDIYHEFLEISKNEDLKVEAIGAIINLDFKMYRQGSKEHIDEVIGFLDYPDAGVKQYAAFTLSYVKNKKIAALAVPILKRLVSRGDEQELTDRAKIALMRIDPGYLKSTPKKKNLSGSMLHIKIFNKDTKVESFGIHIPFALAHLALQSIPSDEKKLLKEKGYDLDQIIRTLIETEDIFKIEGEDTVLRIWID